MTSGIWPDRRQRHAVRLEALVTRDGGAVVTCDVSDLSLDGCCLTGTFRIGEEIQMTIPRIGTHVAQIRWSFMDRSGARFLHAAHAPAEQHEDVGSGGGT